jgi:hypothetical protein
MRFLITGLLLASTVTFAGIQTANALPPPVTVGQGKAICRNVGGVYGQWGHGTGCSACTKIKCTFVACDLKACDVAVLPARAGPPSAPPRTFAFWPPAPEKATPK